MKVYIFVQCQILSPFGGGSLSSHTWLIDQSEDDGWVVWRIRSLLVMLFSAPKMDNMTRLPEKSAADVMLNWASVIEKEVMDY